MSSDFQMGPELMKLRITSPRTVNEKYSGGPNFNAKFAVGGAISINPKMARVPPMKDPEAEIPRAGPARPFLAIW